MPKNKKTNLENREKGIGKYNKMIRKQQQNGKYRDIQGVLFKNQGYRYFSIQATTLQRKIHLDKLLRAGRHFGTHFLLQASYQATTRTEHLNSF